MTQKDEKQLSEIARSISALFGEEENPETKATVPSSGVEEGHVDVSVALGLESELDANAEPHLTAPPGDESETETGALVDVEDWEEADVAGIEEVDAAGIEETDAAGIEETDAAGIEETDAAESEEAPLEIDPALAEIAQALREATSQYLEAPVDEREAAQQALQSALETARSAAALGEIASSLNLLLLQADGDVGVEDLVDELLDEDVLARMVVGLGSIRDEEEREALIGAFVRLGDSVAAAIAGALTITGDRLARKIYVAALAAFGSAGAQAVERMLRDSSWFVVRNGVAVLGAVGEESAIEPLTATLANEHAGVRRETVRSLAKIGGENAGLLVSSMLGDSDAEVRAEAARAVSALKVERAYKQLIEILKDGDEESVIEQVIRALGALGDPSAVPAIEKRVKGSLFSRPPKGVRLAGLAALASIGTPHAVSLVEKARTDKDPEIRSAATQLLSGK